MKNLLITLTVAAFAVSCAGMGSKKNVEKPSFDATATQVIAAEVIEIDQKTRKVTLQLEDGRKVSLKVGKEARNLKQVSKGDFVVVEYIESVSIRVFDPKDVEAKEDHVMAAGRTKKGDMPGAVVMEALVEVWTVEKIDKKNQSYQLRYKGRIIREFKAKDPENLKKGRVGDVVVMTFKRGLAISVQKAVK